MEPTYDPADPHDLRHPEAEPIWETFDIAVEGERPTQHAHRIEALLRAAAGVQSVEAHPSEERVTVTYDARLTNPPAIHDRLLEGGYRAAAPAR